ncbi:MAG: FKBP-type peptidyl-prolyl cis-trans isomerase, partial [Candidatus Glassbacteria bacterium]
MSRGNSIAASGFTLAVVATIFFLALPSMSCGENNVVDKAVTAYLKLYSKLTGSENKETEKVVAVGSKISLNYRGTLADGTVFDSSAGRGPFEFEAGRGEVIPGFDQAVIGMKLNEKKAFTIPAAEAYGEKQESLLRKVPHS